MFLSNPLFGENIFKTDLANNIVHKAVYINLYSFFAQLFDATYYIYL